MQKPVVCSRSRRQRSSRAGGGSAPAWRCRRRRSIRARSSTAYPTRRSAAANPLDLSTRIDARQIERTSPSCAKSPTACASMRSTAGLDQIPEIAQRHGLKVLLGLWVSSFPDRTQYQIDTGIAIANRYPDVRAVIVGNEALLRGEVSAATLREYIASVKARVDVPVTYADVWEFWIRNRESRARSISSPSTSCRTGRTIRSAREAADHVDVDPQAWSPSFSGKDIMIGEFGWPSAGRMRESAQPSPVDQARVIADVLGRGKRRRTSASISSRRTTSRGSVSSRARSVDTGACSTTHRGAQKFAWGAPVSNHPHWLLAGARRRGAGGAVFAAAMMARRRWPDARAQEVAQDNMPDNLTWLAWECDCAERRGRRRVRRLDGCEHPGREPRHRRLGPFARLRRGRDACAGRGLGGAGAHVAQPAGVALCDRVCGERHVPIRSRWGSLACWLVALTALAIQSGARAVVRSALPRLSVCADDRRARAVCPDRAPVKDARKRVDGANAAGRKPLAEMAAAVVLVLKRGLHRALERRHSPTGRRCGLRQRSQPSPSASLRTRDAPG